MRTLHLIKVSEVKIGDTIVDCELINATYLRNAWPLEIDPIYRPRAHQPNKIREILDRGREEIIFQGSAGCVSLSRDSEVILVHRPRPDGKTEQDLLLNIHDAVEFSAKCPIVAFYPYAIRRLYESIITYTLGLSQEIRSELLAGLNLPPEQSEVK